MFVHQAGRAPTGAFSHATNTGLWKGPQSGHGFGNALFRFHATARRISREPWTPPEQQKNDTRPPPTGVGRNTGRRKKVEKSLSDSGFGGEYSMGGIPFRPMKALRMNPKTTRLAHCAPCVPLSGFPGPQTTTHGGRLSHSGRGNGPTQPDVENNPTGAIT